MAKRGPRVNGGPMDLDERLATLDRKLDNLTWIVGAQTILLGVVTASYFLQLTKQLVWLLLVFVPVLVVFRRRLPGCWRAMSKIWSFVAGGRSFVDRPSEREKLAARSTASKSRL